MVRVMDVYKSLYTVEQLEMFFVYSEECVLEYVLACINEY